MSIKINGKELKTSFDFPMITDERYALIVSAFSKKPSLDKVKYEMFNISCGSSVIKSITDYYYRDLMCDCIIYDSKFSINDVLGNKTLVSFIDYVTQRRHKYYYTNSSPDSAEGVKEAFRQFFATGGNHLARSVGQFPLDTVYYILDKYNVNGNYYDFSCGWGSRLAGALSKGINYFGTDPNYRLTERLDTYIQDYKNLVHQSVSQARIFTQGSEVAIAELKGKMGLCFSSTPYFKLEDYRYGNQSCNKGSYEEWKNEYLRPTIENCYSYLVDNGFFIINIKNYKNYTLEEDSCEIASDVGFHYYCTENLYIEKNYVRSNGIQGQTYSINEPMFVFSKSKDIKIPGIQKIELW